MREFSLSVRLLWPFARVAVVDPELVVSLARHGVGAGEFANPETRLSHGAVMELLQQLVESDSDPTIGLRAGAGVEHGDFGALEYASRSCATLREAIQCVGRYIRVLNEAAEVSLREEGACAVWAYRIVDGVPQVPAANDFVVASALAFARMYVDVPDHPLEVHLMHREPTSPAGYAKIFGPNIKLGMGENACVFPRRVLGLPMRRAASSLRVAFETRVRELTDRLREQQGIAGRTRELVFAQLRAGNASMASVADAMAMSIATLRRRLAEEGTTHSQILDQVRRDLARLYLSDSRLSVREISILLGYAQTNGFYGAFRRWEGGMTPAGFRARHRKS